MKKVMLINVLQPEECRIAILENNVLEELYVERASHESYVGNIYKGRVVNIEPSIQAAFVDFGVGRNGFLHVSDVEPTYYRHLAGHGEEEDRRGQRGGPRRGGQPPRKPIPDVEDYPLETEVIEVAPPEFSDEPFHESEELEARMDAQDSGSETQDSGPDSVTFSFGAEPENGGSDMGDEGDKPPSMPSANRITESGDEDDLLFSKPKGEASAPQPADEPFFMGDEIAAPEAPETPEEFSGGDFEQEVVQESGFPESEGAGFSDEPSRGEAPRRDSGRRDGRRDNRREGRGDRRSEGRGDRRDGGRSSRGRSGSGSIREGSRDQGRSGRGMSGGKGGRLVGKPKPMIQDIFKKGQEVIVQVIKEGVGTKGPTLSTYISIAGRYLVLMPGLNRVGVSRKISDEDQRRRLRDIFVNLKAPKGVGFIIRTAGIDRNQVELQRDLAYLCRLWQVVAKRIKNVKSPSEIYQESDMITRTIRDTFTNDIDEIVVDEKGAFEHAQEFLQFVMPKFADRIKYHEGRAPLFHHYRIEEEIAKIQMKKVPLPMGGSIVIEQTEALVAIDVNSGSYRAEGNAEETAYQINLQAAREIGRQLRLRDLGGVIVNDFIDMRDEKHRRAVEKAMRDSVRRDRARTKVLRISPFGIIEMTRQRIRPSLKRSVYHDCPFCKGMASVKTSESMCIEVMRLVQMAAFMGSVAQVKVRVAAETADYLLNNKRREIGKIEEESGSTVSVKGELGVPPELLEVVIVDGQGNEKKIVPSPEPAPRRGRY